ncbi:MAG: hypothetical protein M1818_001529 [Claussenomyces sp. TS43310]|nr:MAG: hypothetical protein M1818_001529 [Claussenomyces sp. TS43310]
MASLSQATENKLLVLGIGFTSVAVLALVRLMLIQHRDSVTIKGQHPKTQYITQETEDALKPSTLEKLIDSHNYGIRDTASTIVLDRALHEPAVLDGVLWEMTRSDHDRREKGIRALQLLSEQAHAIVELDKPKVYRAIVKSLEYCVTDVVHEPYDKDFDSFNFRDAAEQRALYIAYRLSAEFSPGGLIKAGFVNKWLAKEPWGDTEKERQANFADLYRKTGMIAAILSRIIHHSEGRKQLIKAKLVTKNVDLLDDTIDVRMADGEDTAGEVEQGDLTLPPGGNPRISELSPEERRLRRRHRQAMVLNDSDQPVVGSDILQ